MAYNVVMRSLFLVAGVVSPGVAFADADPARSPGFVQIDRYDATSVAGADVTFVSPDGDAEDVTLLRFQVGGHFVDRNSKLGGYVKLPISYTSGDDDSIRRR